MDVAASIDLETSEVERLARILGCKPSEIGSQLGAYASAALEEYVRMFLGERVYTRGSDIREYRLLLLLQHLLGGSVPDDGWVSARFQTTTGQSRGLIRAVLAKFQYELEDGILGSVRKVVDDARNPEGGTVWFTIIRSGNVVTALNMQVELLDAELPLVGRSPGTAARYEIMRSTYLRLCEALGVEVKDDRRK